MNPIIEPTLAVAEGDAVVRERVVRALRDHFKIIVTARAGSGKTALLIRSAHLIIYDLNLGIQDLKSIREEYPEKPIVIISSTATSTLREALELEKTDFVTKPFDTEELKIRVNQCLRKWSLYDSSLLHGHEAAEKKWTPDNLPPRQSASAIEVRLPELHSPSGRVDAAKIAKYLDVRLSELAAALHTNYTTLHKTPDAPSVQPGLLVFKRILTILLDMLGPQKTVRAWMNTPHPALGKRTPISVVLAGHSDAVLTILENALIGVPS